MMEDMTSAEVREKLRNRRKRRTGFKVGGTTLNMSVHVGVDSPVGTSIVARCDEDRVPLCNSEGNQVYRILFYVSLYLNISSYSRTQERRHTQSNSMIRISCPSIQK